MTRFLFILLGAASLLGLRANDAAAQNELFERDNLAAWCIVPFDSQKRGPEARAAMLAKLGLKKFVYDYRAEHIPQWEDELNALSKHQIELLGWWFPTTLNEEAQRTLELFKRHNVKPQLWVTGNGGSIETNGPDDQRRRVAAEVARLEPICRAAEKIGCRVGLYNHGNWFGEPENQLDIIAALKEKGVANVGVVYNLHHGHGHLDRLDKILTKCRDALLCVNLNGMDVDGEARGRKILPLGVGSEDVRVLKILRDSGYRGPIGVLNHTDEDAEARLLDNLDGLAWLLPQLDGKPAGAAPKLRSRVPPAKPQDASADASLAPAYLTEARPEFQAPPLWLELRAKLTSRDGYNILTAAGPKSSPAHWELFTMPGNGWLTVYLPGATPDHVRSSIDVADGRPHEIAMHYESNRVRLFVDGKLAVEQAIERQPSNPAPERFAIGRLVEGGIACRGAIEFVHLAQGRKAREPRSLDAPLPTADDETIALWLLAGASGDVEDRSPRKLPARRQSAATAVPGGAALPASGVHLAASDPRLKVTLIDRSLRDVYMGVKVDQDGRLFVGGRDKLFLFRPSGRGFGPRQTLLQFPPDSIIIGLEFRGDDLYVLTDNALYLVPEGRIRASDLRPRRILWGLPLDLHVSFHSLAWGPEGKLYLTHGDPLLGFGDWNRPDHWGCWTLFCGEANTPVPYTGQGAVLRVDPDGKNLEVVARGLRGPVGLAFDEAGCLFTNDNDHESRAAQYAPMRLLHVVPGIDFSWPRGWMASKSPDRRDLIEPMSADLGRGVPCDMAFVPTTHPIDSLAGRLLLCRWDRGTVAAYRPRARGVSFTTDEEIVLTGDDNARPVGVALAPDGRLFVTMLYMTGNQAAPDCPSDVVVVDRADGAPLSFPAPTTPRATKIAEPKIDDALAAASSDDDYLRQLGASRLAVEKDAVALRTLLASSDERTRLAGVLAIGTKLTVPAPHDVPPSDVVLTAPKDSAFFKVKQRFHGVEEPVDLASRGRMGSYTIAGRWAAVKPSAEERALFEALVAALDDSSPIVRLQAAFYLDLLNDSRTTEKIEATRRDVVVQRLAVAPTIGIEDAWRCGPFIDDAQGKLAPSHPPEAGAIDLSATYGDQSWKAAKFKDALASPDAPASTYFSIRLDSESRQPGLLSILGRGVAAVWNNGTRVASAPAKSVSAPNAAADQQRYTLDLQPGGNELLIRWQPHDRGSAPAFTLQAAARVAAHLADKLDSAMLAERLRQSAGGAIDPAILKAFEGRDWIAGAKRGDAAQGRRLFGTLGCVKCHAVSAQQEIVGAPSLADARQRFSVPHLVESILVPSRQVAEPFRMHVITTTEGLVVNGLVVGESSEAVEVLLPDASRKSIPRASIEEREPAPISVMPVGLVKTPEELEHLLAYLLSERPLPP